MYGMYSNKLLKRFLSKGLFEEGFNINSNYI